MSEFFLELFSEEKPSCLQKSLREELLNSFIKEFNEKSISFKKSSSFSTPNRLVILFEGLQKQITLKSEEIKGPNVKAPEVALEGFIRSNNINKKDLFKQTIDKGEFYFFKTKSIKLNTQNLLEELVPSILNKIQWKKYMIFVDFKDYNNFFKKLNITIDHNLRKNLIEKKLNDILSKKNIIIENNPKLLDEVVDLTDQPNVILCEFDRKFLNIPKEILIITMQYHQKYFPTFDKKGNITNEFLVVTNKKDINGLIKLGNERVVEARLSDAEFFWKKDKSQNLVKRVSMLKSMNYFKGLGTYFDKVQRMRKLG